MTTHMAVRVKLLGMFLLTQNLQVVFQTLTSTVGVFKKTSKHSTVHQLNKITSTLQHLCRAPIASENFNCLSPPTQDSDVPLEELGQLYSVPVFGVLVGGADASEARMRQMTHHHANFSFWQQQLQSPDFHVAGE